MGKVSVVIVDATGNKEQKVGLPDDIKCGIIMVKLVEKIKLPSVGPDGNPISYKFIHKVTGRQLLEAQTLSEAGIKDGDVLRLQPEITAGAVCGKCGNNEPDSNPFCSRCGNNLTTPQPIYTAVAQQTYTPQVTDTATAKTGNGSKAVLILGIISVALYILSNILLLNSDISYTSSAYTLFRFLSTAAQGIFMLAVSLYMAFKLRKQG